MATKLVYEMKSCSRCGGSGHYSYCQMYGTTCFKCGGRKRTLSAAGSKASLAIKAFIAEHFSVPVEKLTPGTFIKVEGVTRKVASVEPSGTTGSSTVNGVTKTYPCWTLNLTKPVKSPFGAYSSMGMPEGALMVKAPTGADWDAVVA
ncbi:MAG TPA: hypothetical protein VFP27_09155, partial [Mycobacterium sp.]|nr:hypothetical protein [Mycobacterium sp.]